MPILAPTVATLDFHCPLFYQLHVNQEAVK